MLKRVSIVLSTLIVSFFSLLMVIIVARKFGFESSDFHDPAKVIAPLTITTAIAVMVFPILLVIGVQSVILRGSISFLDSSRPALGACIFGCALGTLLKGLATCIWLVTTPGISISFAAAGTTFFEWLPFFSWFLFGLVLNSFSEELVFRAFPVKVLDRFLNPFLVVTISAILFSVMHFAVEEADLGRFLYRSFFGLLAGIIYVRTRSLAWVVGLHTGWNFISWVISDSGWQVGTVIRVSSSSGHGEVVWNILILILGSLAAIYPIFRVLLSLSAKRDMQNVKRPIESF